MTAQPSAGPLSTDERKRRLMDWRSYLIALAYGIVFVLLTTLTLAMTWPSTGQFELNVGDVSPTDIRSPRYIAFISESLTEEARQEAANRAPDIFVPLPGVRGDQVRRSHAVLELIENVRNSEDSESAKLARLQAIPEVSLDQATWQGILALDDEAWQRVKAQVPTGLNMVLLNQIRDTQLESARRLVPGYIDLMAAEEAQAAVVLVQALMRPNMTLDVERTEESRQLARNSVVPITNAYEQNEIIVRQGDVITAQHMEVLRALGLNQPQQNWSLWARSLVIALLLAVVFGIYLLRVAPSHLLHPRRLGLLVALLGVFLFLAKLMVPGQTWLPYVFPLPALIMLLNPLLGVALAFLVSVYFGVVIAELAAGSVPVLVYSAICPLIGALVLGKADRTAWFVRAGAAVSLASLAVLIAFNLPSGPNDMAGLGQLAAAAVVNGGLAASITLIGFYLLGAIFDIATPLRLVELARPNHPLMRDLIMKAPGTYHHSLIVGNMAEQAAEAVGGDAFLTRIGAYYHDIGKIARPYFFAENRLEGTSPHDQLDPWSSAQIIINHVRDGLEIGRRHKLPRRVLDFIAEHQGTGLVRYFYHEAQQVTDPTQVDEKDFRYPGPRPQSKETAILMLADGCESAVRAARSDSKETIDEVVRKIINQRLMEGELSESDLTLRDLDTIRQIFVRSLQGVHHPRITYPELPSAPPTTPADEPQQGSPVAG